MERLLRDRVELHCGNMLDVLATLPADSLDSCVTDPPYHLTSIVKRFSNTSPERETFAMNNPVEAYGRLSRGFMGKLWDGGDVAFDPATWRAVFRVLKPGAHLVACGGTRTYHRMATAIEDAGFEIRDCVSWLYGSGFPKSHSVAIGIDRANGHAPRSKAFNYKGGGERADEFAENGRTFLPPYEPATDEAREWDGWGTALKPAAELIVLARKPLSEGTVAANVLKWRTGAINVDACRVGDEVRSAAFTSFGPCHGNRLGAADTAEARRGTQGDPKDYVGRWPANVCHDGSDEVVAAFPEALGQAGTVTGNEPSATTGNIFSRYEARSTTAVPRDNGGSAARFFFAAKADADDRLGSAHPTVKPVDLMQWLVRMVTPPGGTVLDPFSGTGTTGEAAWREGMSAVLVEAEPEYQADIRRRMALAMSGPDERSRESMKEKQRRTGAPPDYGPLFSGITSEGPANEGND